MSTECSIYQEQRPQQTQDWRSFLKEREIIEIPTDPNRLKLLMQQTQIRYITSMSESEFEKTFPEKDKNLLLEILNAAGENAALRPEIVANLIYD